MKFTAKEVVRGATNMKYNIDGENIASLALHIDVKMDPTQGGFGYRTEAMAVDSEEVIKSIQHNPFPFQAELEVEQRATKGKTKLVVIGVKPIVAVKQTAAA
ncbi:MAG: hypothetical protein JWN73_41 [Betaproteobacteria bacterium]|nr:hypothetical protein [Betaproteobacteria bacterium]